VKIPSRINSIILVLQLYTIKIFGLSKGFLGKVDSLLKKIKRISLNLSINNTPLALMISPFLAASLPSLFSMTPFKFSKLKRRMVKKPTSQSN
jgi:hypothetical protein